MDATKKIHLMTGAALVVGLLVMYFGAVHIDGLVRRRYLNSRGVRSADKYLLAEDTALSSFKLLERARRSDFFEEDSSLDSDQGGNDREVLLRRAKVHTRVVDAQLDRTYWRSVNASLEYLFQYSAVTDPDRALRVRVQSRTAAATNPVLVVVRRQQGVLSWQLPFLSESSADPRVAYDSVSRTLCPTQRPTATTPASSATSTTSPPAEQEEEEEEEFMVGVSTSNGEDVEFELAVERVDRFVVGLNDNVTVDVSVSQPRYFKFEFPEGVSNVLLAVESPDDICMSVSVQNLKCPVLDTDRDLKYEGIWQTVMNKTGMSISRERFPSGFFVVFVVKADDYECTGVRRSPTDALAGRSWPTDRTKTLRFSIREKVSYINFMLAVTGVLGIFSLFYVVTFITFCINRRGDVPEELEPSLLEVGQDRQHYGSVTAPIVGVATATPRLAPPSPSPSLGSRSSSLLDVSDVDLLPDAFSDKDVVRTKTFLFVADLARKGPRFHAKKSQLYIWNLLVVAVFYALPVFQLVVIYQKVVNDTGDQDLCYYNFLCAHPLGDLTDFNHVYSNLGYILLGLLFIILTARRDVLRRRAQLRHDRLERFYGIPQHFGLCYSMGTALMVEGVLSACYHICPTHANYQFDTTFMYVISMLCMLKIYQTRHPDINAEAHASFAVLALVVLLGVVSVFEDSLAFRIVFSGLHLLACLALCAQVYYMGRWKLNVGVFKRIYLVCWNDFQAGPSNWFRPMYVDRMTLLVIGLLVNFGLAVYGLVEQPADFASHVLAIFITNQMLYTFFYIIMKLRSGEKIRKVPLFFIGLSTVCWAFAMFFFVNKATTWKKRAAQSKTFNKECLLFNFYDFHDVWHFLSAVSLFFSFVILLTLDDDLLYTPRDKIPVF